MTALRFTYILFILALFSFTIQAQGNGHVEPSEVGLSENGIQRYENFLKQEIEAGRLPGAVSLISRKGKIAHDKAFGFTKLSTREPMTTDRIFYIQSMTKPVISVAFMMLFEEGKFFLTDPVADYLPEFNDLKVVQIKRGEDGEVPDVEYVPLQEPVRIWHLLSHTAGFSHGLGQNDYDQKLSKLLYETPHSTIRDRVDALVGYPLMGQPGKQWNYSASPDVLALLIEHFSGQAVDEFLQERIFDPLGMSSTGYNVSDDNLSRVVGLHGISEDGNLESVDQWSPLQGNTVYGGTHGLFSSAQDYLKFGQMLLNQGEYNGQRIISRKTLELMTENHIVDLPYDDGNGFGLGFGVRTDVSDSKLSGSEGAFYWSGAFNTYFFVDEEEDMVALLMTQFWPYTNFYASKLRQFMYSAISD